jgi:hypothetical protein
LRLDTLIGHARRIFRCHLNEFHDALDMTVHSCK